MLIPGIWATAAVGIGAIACVAVAVMVGLGRPAVVFAVPSVLLAGVDVGLEVTVSLLGAVVEGIGSGCVGGGSLIVDGPPTGPEQVSPMRQHPIMPLLARTQ